MRFASLGSGSQGNGTLVEKDRTCILVDCGFAIAETEQRLARLGKRPEDITAIVISHEHGDHVSGVGPLAKKYDMPVWATAGTAQHNWLRRLVTLHRFSSHRPFAIGDLQVQPFPVPHDAREPTHFVFSDGVRKMGVLTDTGSSTPHIEQCLTGCDALMLESNHDSDMLANGEYTKKLKKRVAGQYGHLSNRQAAELLSKLDCSKLQHLVAMHLSAKNNTPQLAREALSNALRCAPDWIGIADQDVGLEWREIY
ncbi:MAG: MBL fold metallo-hydrolase [Gammaproteobacteria bacterium]|nr:MBL fold metallo-hydrolase [Gammaproteobacteria bacterium]